MIESHDLCQMMANDIYHRINGVNRNNNSNQYSQNTKSNTIIFPFGMHGAWCMGLIVKIINNSFIHSIEYCEVFGSHLEYHFMRFITINLMHSNSIFNSQSKIAYNCIFNCISDQYSSYTICCYTFTYPIFSTIAQTRTPYNGLILCHMPMFANLFMCSWGRVCYIWFQFQLK